MGILDQLSTALAGDPSLEGTDRFLANPLFNIGMGLLAARYDNRINPSQAAMSGLLNAANQSQAAKDQAYKDQQQAALLALQKTMGGILNYQDPTTQLFRPQAANTPGAAMPSGPAFDPASGLFNLPPESGVTPPTPQPGPASMLDPQSRQLLASLSTSDPKAAATLYTQMIDTAVKGPSGGNSLDPRIQNWALYKQLQQQEKAGVIPKGEADKFFNSTLQTPALHFDPQTGTWGYLPAGAALGTGAPLFGQNPNAIPAAVDLSGKTQGAKTDAEKTALFTTAYPDVINTFNDHLQNLQSLRAQMAALDPGPILGSIKSKLLSDYQNASAATASEGLRTMGALHQMGVSLAPMSEADRDIIFNTSPKMTNDRDANLKIIDRAISNLERQRGAVTRQRLAIANGKTLGSYMPPAVTPQGGLLSDEAAAAQGAPTPATTPPPGRYVYQDGKLVPAQ